MPETLLASIYKGLDKGFYTLSHLLPTPGNASSTVRIVMPPGVADASQPVQPIGTEAGMPRQLGDHLFHRVTECLPCGPDILVGDSQH